MYQILAFGIIGMEVCATFGAFIAMVIGCGAVLESGHSLANLIWMVPLGGAIIGSMIGLIIWTADKF